MNGMLWFLTIVVIMIILLLYGQNRIVFTQYGTNVNISQYNMPIKEVTYSSHDEKDLYALHIKHEDPLGIIMFWHGNAGTVSEWIPYVKRYYDWGFSVFMMEYRGYGKCPGSPTESLVYRDAMSSYKYVTDTLKYSSDRIILSGMSLGGAVCINLAARVDSAAVIVDSSFTSMSDIADTFIPYVGRYLCNFSFDSINLIEKIKSPCLIIHSKEDELIPFEMSERLCKNASKCTLMESTGGHTDFNWNSHISDTVRSFCEDSINKSF